MPFHSIISKKRGFKVGSINIASIYKHIDELRLFMEKQPLDILAINETRLDKTVPDSVVNLVGYNIVRQDRNRNGGGVCVYIRTSIEFRRRLDLENDSLEMIALDIKKPNSRSFLVSCWYRPPHSPVECFDIFEECLNKAEDEYKDIYITGDINCNVMSNSPESHTSRLVNLIETHQLSQLINQPTRVTEETRTLIDLFITNSEESILHSGVYPLSISDHNLIYAVRKISIPRSSPRYIETKSFKNFKTGEFKSEEFDNRQQETATVIQLSGAISPQIQNWSIGSSPKTLCLLFKSHRFLPYVPQLKSCFP